MSKLFFDHLLKLDDVNIFIKKSASSTEEHKELIDLVDNIVTTNVLDKILSKLDKKDHEEFLALFHKCPHDEIQIFAYLNTKTGKDINKVLEQELKDFSKEILSELTK